MRTALALLVGRLVRKVIRSFRHGGGSAIPGTIAAKIQPNLLAKAIESFPGGLVVVSGSAGKSSTTKYLVKILQSQGLVVFTNPSTANIFQGLYAAVLQSETGIKMPAADIAVLEMDEAHAASLAAKLNPRLSVLTNVMDEQLDRFHDSSVVRGYLAKLAEASKLVVLNFDDPNLNGIAGVGFGLASQLKQLPTAPRYALNSASAQREPDCLVTAASNDHLEMRFGGQKLVMEMGQQGLHMTLNIAAALSAAVQLVPDIDWVAAVDAIATTPEVLGRDSRLIIEGVETRILLVQNPESFRINNALIGNPGQLLMAIGTDVHDPSWLWSVDFSGFPSIDVLSGHHAYPMAHRLSSQNVSVAVINPDFASALEGFVKQPPAESGGRVMILTADTFRRAKRQLELGE